VLLVDELKNLMKHPGMISDNFDPLLGHCSSILVFTPLTGALTTRVDVLAPPLPWAEATHYLKRASCRRSLRGGETRAEGCVPIGRSAVLQETCLYLTRSVVRVAGFCPDGGGSGRNGL
jgi:hypothetical protein